MHVSEQKGRQNLENRDSEIDTKTHCSLHKSVRPIIEDESKPPSHQHYGMRIAEEIRRTRVCSEWKQRTSTTNLRLPDYHISHIQIMVLLTKYQQQQ